MDKINLETIKAIVPKSMKGTITQDFVDDINNISSDIEYAGTYRQNLLTLTNVLKEGPFSFKEYMNAVKYVTYKVCGDTNKEAYAKTFPERYEKMIKDNWLEKDLQSIFSRYGKSMLVTKVMEKTIIPTHILFRDFFHEAVIETMKLGRSAKSEMVRQKALQTIIQEVKPPGTAQIEIDMNIKDKDDIVSEYKNALAFAAEEQLKMIEQGGSVKNIANMKLKIDKDKIIDVETEEDS